MPHRLALLLALFLAAAAGAQTPEPPPRPGHVPDGLVVTEHVIEIDDDTLRYRARTGTLAITGDDGRKTADFFFIAYDRLAAEGGEADTSRPVTFLFNGGPGSAAVWLHQGAVGPKVIALDETGRPLAPPRPLVVNPHTWLRFTDLVLIDPVGTGYSRAAEGVEARQFYGVESDIASVGQFIRRYLTEYSRWGSPKFLAGESYGTTRAAGLAEHLIDTEGIALNGIVLLSTVLDFATIQPGRNNLLPYALYLPSYTAVAHYHGKLPPPLQEMPLPELLPRVERWALSSYLSALARGGSLPSDQRDHVASRVAGLTGLNPGLVKEAGLRISPFVFQKELLDERPELVGRFDGRITGAALEPVSPYPAYDPSLSYYLPIYAAAFHRYVQSELGYESPLKYEILSDRVHPWDYGEDRQGYLETASRLRAAIAKQPFMRVMIASGLYDLATPYFAADHTIHHLDLPADLRDNVVQTYYPGGHMMYHEAASLQKLADDARRFYQETLSPSEPRP